MSILTTLENARQEAITLVDNLAETSAALTRSQANEAAAQKQIAALQLQLEAQIPQESNEPATKPPAAPTDLHIVTIDRNSVTLGWTDNSSNETAFQVETRPTDDPSRPWEPIKTSEVDAQRVEILLPAKDWRYDFRVVAIGPVVRDDDGRPYTLNSEPSNVLANVFIQASSWIEKPAPLPIEGINWDRALRLKDPKNVAAAIEQCKKDKVPIIIEDQDFNGIQIKLEAFAPGFRIAHNRIRNIPGGWFAGNGVLLMGGSGNGLIFDNDFTAIGDADIAGGYGNSRNVYIYGNRHTMTKEGIHLVGGGPETTVDIYDSTFEGIQRMAIELQGGGKWYKVRRCTGKNWRPHTDRDRFFISMAAVETLETLIEDCHGVGEGPMGDPVNRLGICFEVAGRNATLRRSSAKGPWISATALSGHSDPVKSIVTFEDFESCGWNEPWGAPHLPGGIYRDGTPAGNITIVRGKFSKKCA